MGIKSLWILGTQFFFHMMAKLFRRYRPGGRERFDRNYRADRILAVPSEFSGSLSMWQRCTGCGLCDAICPIAGIEVEGRGFSISRLALSAWRDLSAVHLSVGDADLMSGCKDCLKCETVCPERIPLMELGRFIREFGRDVGKTS